MGSQPNGLENIVDENAKTWWNSNDNEAWVTIDLEKDYDIRAIQINFADNHLKIGEISNVEFMNIGRNYRYIDTSDKRTRWILEGSNDGNNFILISDKSKEVIINVI